MDKTMQETGEMQDEEIYALLEQALTQERLSVSEELIQKTLQKIEEQETAEHVPDQRKTGKKFAVMRYAPVAAAAVLLVVLGIGMKGGIGRKEMANEAAPDFMLSNAENEVAFEYSGSSGRGDSDVIRKNGAPLDSKAEISYSVSEELADKYMLDSPEPGYLESTVISIAVVRETTEVGDDMAESALTAECWELVDQGSDWEAELVEKLTDWEAKAELLPKTGEYVYTLACNDGSKTTIGFGEPLTMILRIQTERGMLWCLFGEELYMYREK